MVCYQQGIPRLVLNAVIGLEKEGIILVEEDTGLEGQKAKETGMEGRKERRTKGRRNKGKKEQRIEGTE